jgi:hypothetical protein
MGRVEDLRILCEVTDMQGFSLNVNLIEDIFAHAKPLGHNEEPENCNLGFGFIYYGMVRAVRPNHVVVIGSGFGFSVVCLALGLKDNGHGKLSFVDPSYDVFKDGLFKTVGGRGKWNEPEKVSNHFRQFNVDGIVSHYKCLSDEFFQNYEGVGLPKIDVAFVDGNHSYENVKGDFLNTLMHSHKNTYIFLHDTNIYLRELVRHSGVKRWLNTIAREKELFQTIDLPFSSGVAIVRVLRNDAWKCLSI